MVYIGCSGFYYPAWKPGFYPDDLPKSRWFQYYAERFNTLELNNTFYKFPTSKSLRNYYEKSPADFVFSIKVPRLITHYKQLKDCNRLLADFYASVNDGLGEKTGAILFQFHSRFVYSDENLALLWESFNNTFINVAEFRHSSWFTLDALKKLQQQRIHISGTSHPDFPLFIPADKDMTYFRFHGVPVLYKSSYSKKDMEPVVDIIREINSKQVFVYFNNTITTAGIKNAKLFRKTLQLHTK